MSLGKEVDPGPGRVVLDGGPAPNSGAPHLRAMHVVAGRSPISATAGLLRSSAAMGLDQRGRSGMVIVLRPQMCDVASSYLLDECLDCGERRGNFWGRDMPAHVRGQCALNWVDRSGCRLGWVVWAVGPVEHGVRIGTAW